MRDGTGPYANSRTILRPAVVKSISRCFARSPLQGRPCLAGVRSLVSSLCPKRPGSTVLSHLLTKVSCRFLRGFKHAGISLPLSMILSLSSLILSTRDILLAIEQPKSIIRVFYHTTRMSTDCRIDFAVVYWVVFKVFPCRLWGLEPTVLAGGDSSSLCKYPPGKVFTSSQLAPRGGESHRQPTDVQL